MVEKEQPAEVENVDEAIVSQPEDEVEVAKQKQMPGPFTWYEKLAAVEQNPDGSYSHKYYKVKLDKDKPRHFQDLKTFKSWEAKHVAQIQRGLRERLSPHEYFITQGKGTERAFTGEYVWNLDLGTYECVTCT